MSEIILNTACGAVRGTIRSECLEFLGIRYATAGRFEYCNQILHWDGIYDASAPGSTCPQTRTWYEHLEIPERMFYHREFRDGIVYSYDEDCLSLNIYTPKEPGQYPVILYIHGGGFNSGTITETHLDGAMFARRGIILVTAHYRVGVLGYLTHEEIYNKYGHDGNFGLHDQFTALQWVRDNIADYGGDPGNITLMGQSAGAISIQYLCLCNMCKGMFRHAVMLSGGGCFPKFALPRPAEKTREYWLQLMDIMGLGSFDELKTAPLYDIFTAVEKIKTLRKDSTYNTMPVIDGYLITDHVDKLIKEPLPVDYLLGYTNNDMYAIVMSHVCHKYAREHNAFLYYFDIDAKGDDNNAAFHSSDLRYIFGTLDKSHRPYDSHDYEISDIMNRYICNFAVNGDPNGPGLPEWSRGGSSALVISKQIEMGHPGRCRLLYNTLFRGEPK